MKLNHSDHYRDIVEVQQIKKLIFLSERRLIILRFRGKCTMSLSIPFYIGQEVLKLKRIWDSRLGWKWSSWYHNWSLYRKNSIHQICCDWRAALYFFKPYPWGKNGIWILCKGSWSQIETHFWNRYDKITSRK